MRRKNIIAAAVLIAFVIVYAALTAQLPVRTLPNTPDPSFFPWVNTAIILVLSIWLLARGLRQPKTEPASAVPEHRQRVVFALGAFVIYLAAMPALGFVLATVPFFAAMMVLFGERRPAWVGGGAVGMTIALYFLFRHGFGVYLPRGLLAGFIA